MQVATVKDGSRSGRGFSLEELKEAGLNARVARKSGIPTDVWRKTKYAGNVDQLKSAMKSIKESAPKEKPVEKEESPKPKATRKVAKRAGKKKQKRPKK
ncbi:MAG: ribosomal protein L13e [Nitrososphaera sp.]|nr:ribosomal protein L13e [Nitrososphaera sp.]